MLVLINGIPYFAERMESDFSEYDPTNRYVYCDTYNSFWGRIKFFLLMPFAAGVVSASGVSDRSRALDWVLRWRKKLILYWQGTDVSIAHGRYKDGTIDWRYIRAAKHIVVAPWFVDELKEIEIDAEYVPYANVEDIGNDRTYDSFRVLTYLAKGKEDFYGWQPVRELARSRPDIPITVVGSLGEDLEVFPNIEFLGWVDGAQMHELMKTHAVYVRLTEHDGKSFAVAQALSAGCEVIWTYAYFQCHQLPREGTSLIKKIDELKEATEKRGMMPNFENIEHAHRSYERSIILSRLTNTIKEYLQ